MKKISAVLAIPVLAAGLAVAQDQPATSREANNPPTARVDETQRPVEHRPDYGWLGLIGLAGLLGLRRKRDYSDRTVTMDRGANYAGGDVRRAG